MQELRLVEVKPAPEAVHIPNSRMRSAVMAAAALLSSAVSTTADDAVRMAHIRRIEDARIRVDGRLDEPVWSQLEKIDGFVQTEPLEGTPVSERTEAFLFYDSEKIYIGFKCYDSEPEKIIARYATHDARTHSDSVNIFLDPFGDRRTGYFFSVNARGVQFDALLSEATEMDPTWDGIWESATQLENWGWSAEVAIPFKSIRFRAGQTWGINLGRDIVRKNETANWQLVTRFDHFFRPSKAALLEGIENVKPGRNLELIPYGSTRFRRGAPDPLDNSNKWEGGADLRWGLRPNMTVNAAINPDFAETEADEINITISRYELFFPEKRPFFTEGSNFFSTPLGLFFTRRVGARLPDGQPQRLLLGAKLTGRTGPWSVGMMEARTQATHFTLADPVTGARSSQFAPAANFFVLRVQRDILKNSSIGFITVNRDQGRGDIGSTQRVHAVDLDIVAGPHLKWTTQGAFNQNQTTTRGGIHRGGFASSLDYNSDRWEAHTGYKYLGRSFDVSEIGFEPQTDRHSAYGAVSYKPFINRYGIRQVFYELNYDSSSDTEGLLQDSVADLFVRAQFKNFWSVESSYSYNRTRFQNFSTAPNCPPPYVCGPVFNQLNPTRIYIEPRVELSLETNENRQAYIGYTFSTQKMVQFRENFYGREQRHAFYLSARLFGRTRIELNGTIVREFLMDHTPFQNRRLFITRVTHQFTNKFRMRVLGQVTNDRLGRLFTLNSIVAYDFTARSAFIVGYNYQRSAPLRPGDLGNEFFAKLSYLFGF